MLIAGPAAKMMDIAEFNYIESGLWFAIAAVLFISALKQGLPGPYVQVLSVSCISFLAFGVSDLVEAQTGAWWRPFWLLILKVVCVAVLVACYVWYQRIRRKSGQQS